MDLSQLILPVIASAWGHSLAGDFAGSLPDELSATYASERLTMPDLIAANGVGAFACVVPAMTIAVFKPEAHKGHGSV